MNIVNYELIGKRIRKQRKEKGLSQERLAEQVGVSLSFIGHVERGTRVLSVETLARLCKALEMDMHYVVFGCPNGHSEPSHNREGSFLSEDAEIFIHRRPAQSTCPCQFRYIHLSCGVSREVLVE